MPDKINPELHNGWKKTGEESEPTPCAWFQNGEAVITVEAAAHESAWRVTLGHRKRDPEVNDTWGRKEAAIARAKELMLTYKEYVNPTTYTIEIELMRDSEADIDHLFARGGYAVGENTDNSILDTKIIETN